MNAPCCKALLLVTLLFVLGCEGRLSDGDAPKPNDPKPNDPAVSTPSAGTPSAGTPAASGEVQIEEAYGRTMGTTYAIKIANAPDSLPEDWRLKVDAELRLVNDQMSTYLESSELSRFNRSDSTDWFAVSADTAAVVSYALEVSRQTEGAFDVTVAPLVNAWSFGPDERTHVVPSGDQIKQIRGQIGYQHLEARMEPPGLRKAIPVLTVDLSAIAKGHGVDRIVELLVSLGAEHVFVEIGGEVRVAGGRVDRPWGVGIQQPDGAPSEVLTALPMSDGAIATSGDYRNFFDVGGQRYSHTIDPRSGKPVAHPLASVSVRANNCMMADAWATAINVLGPEAGLDTARRLNLDVMLIVREGDRYQVTRTGVFDGH